MKSMNTRKRDGVARFMTGVLVLIGQALLIAGGAHRHGFAPGARAVG
ncbi:hypothetical protein [Pseudomonas sp.]